MQGSMRWVVAIIATILSLAIGLTVTAVSQGATTRSSCSDTAYLGAAIRNSKKTVTALKYAQQDRYGSAVGAAKTALWIIRNSTEPCDEDSKSYWLHRQYSIKYSVALYRYLEEMRSGDYDSADIYWSSVKFWGDEKRDITLAW